MWGFFFFFILFIFLSFIRWLSRIDVARMGVLFKKKGYCIDLYKIIKREKTHVLQIWILALNLFSFTMFFYCITIRTLWVLLTWLFLSNKSKALHKSFIYCLICFDNNCFYLNMHWSQHIRAFIFSRRSIFYCFIIKQKAILHNKVFQKIKRQ